MFTRPSAPESRPHTEPVFCRSCLLRPAGPCHRLVCRPPPRRCSHCRRADKVRPGTSLASKQQRTTHTRRLHRTTINPNASTRTRARRRGSIVPGQYYTPRDRPAKPASQNIPKLSGQGTRAFRSRAHRTRSHTHTLSLYPSPGAVLQQPAASLPTPPACRISGWPLSRTGSRVMLVRSTGRT